MDWPGHRITCNPKMINLLSSTPSNKMNITPTTIIDEDTPNAHFYNTRGAKIYLDITKQDSLKIPRLNSIRGKGKTYEVLSAGHGVNVDECHVTIKEKVGVKLYRLPRDSVYTEWIHNCVVLSHACGINMFPCRVEFGYIINENRYYAEIL